MVANEFSEAELEGTEKEREQPQPEYVVPVVFAVEEDVVDGLAKCEQQCEAPSPETEVFEFCNALAAFGTTFLKSENYEEGCGEHWGDATDDEEEGGKEG